MMTGDARAAGSTRTAVDPPARRRARPIPCWRPDLRHWLRKARPHGALIGVLIGFAVAAVVVPTLTPVATTDDWAYARSVEILFTEGRLEIFPVVAATAVFQVVWGSIFAALFGATLGVIRLSTVVMVGLGGWALYGLCRQLGVARGASALGTAAYLFNPLAFVLAFTFMTDPHFASLLIVSTLGYARGLGYGPAAPRWTVAGSAVAGLAFLTRQQGVLIPIAVVLFLLLTRQLRPTRAGAALFARVVGMPVVAFVGYYIWLRFVTDVPYVQTSFLREATNFGWDGTWRLVRRLSFTGLMYLGCFALPLLAGAVPRMRRLVQSTPPAGWVALCIWEAVVIGGLAATWGAGQRMPYLGQFLGSGGPGAPDVLGSKPRLFSVGFLSWATVVCAAAAILLGLVLLRRLGAARSPERSTAGLVLAIGLAQAVGVLPPSYHYLNRQGSLDRYLLPLLPLTICLALWALRDVPIARPVSWLAVAAFAVVAVGGTRDYLVYMGAVWNLARDANTAGVANEQLDAGSGWDGYHLYEYSRANRIPARTPNGPWWVYFYAPATDSSYVVAGKPLPGYAVVTERTYSSWLETEPTRVYLLRRFGLPIPPGLAAIAAEGNRPIPTTPTPPASTAVPPPTATARPAPPAGTGIPPPPGGTRGGNFRSWRDGWTTTATATSS